MYAQHSLNNTFNLSCGGNRFVKQQVDYKNPGYTEESLLWNFSQQNPVNEYYQLTYLNERNYKENISLSGHPKGWYILRILVNEKEFGEKILEQ